MDIHTTAAVLVLAMAPMLAIAQRLDGCPTTKNPVQAVYVPTAEAADRALASFGIGAARAELLGAMDNPRAEVRSLAGIQLAERGSADLAPLLRSWAGEQDECTKGVMRHALSVLVSRLSFDPAQHPEGQIWIAPFQQCASRPQPLITLKIEQVGRPSAVPTIQITARNESVETIAFAGAASPEELFSPTVLDPSGAPVAVPDGVAPMYRPLAQAGIAVTTHGRHFVPLPPHRDVQLWTWSVGEYFEMSEPGTCRVSLAARFPYLATTVCSNTLNVEVGN